MSSYDKEVGGRYPATVWRKRRKHRRSRPNDDNDIHPLVRGSVAAAREFLVSEQDSELGRWCGQVTADPHVTAEYLLLLHWLRLAETNEELVGSLRSFLLDSAKAEGIWSTSNIGTSVSTSTLCYLALKLSGSDSSDPFMSSVRETIRARGGAETVNGLTRFYLSLFGQDSFDRCPVLPPEFLLLPWWLPLSVTRWSRWARAILVPLSIIWALRPVRDFGPECEIEELFLNPAKRWTDRYAAGASKLKTWKARWLQWTARTATVATIALEKAGIRPLRRPALRVAERWLIERLDDQNGIAGSTTATVLAAMALDALKHPIDSIPLTTCLTAIRGAQTQTPADRDDVALEREAIGVSPARVAIQDNAIVARSLTASGMNPHADTIRTAVEWLLQGESVRPGDWSYAVKAEPGGWSREFSSDHYPHITATAQVLQTMREPFANNPTSSLVVDDSMVAMIRANSMNLARREIAVLDRVAAASRRARLWLLAMQNPNGGWPCADRHPSHAVLYSPRFTERFPIHDQSTAEATGLVLQALGTWEMGCGQSSVDRGVSFLRELQNADGSWSSIHRGSDVRATAQVILGLRAVGISWRDMTISRASRWLCGLQQANGGWLARPCREFEGQPTCPTQTAWALLALERSGLGDDEQAHQAAKYLVDKQLVTGAWVAHLADPQGGADLVECDSNLSNTAVPLLALAMWGLNRRVLD